MSSEGGLSRDTSKIYITILEAGVQARDEDPMGAVTSGWLKVRAKLRPISAIVLAKDPSSVSAHDVLCNGTKVGEGHLDIANQSIERPDLFALLVLRDGVAPRGLLLEGTTRTSEYKRVGSYTFWRGGTTVFRARVDFFDDCEDRIITLV
jgi:hypothetical protein